MSEPVSAFRRIAPHVVVPGLLGEAAVGRLLSHIEASEPKFEATRIGFAETARLAPEVRTSSKMRFGGEAAAEFMAAVTTVVPSLLERLGMRPFTPSGYELELVAHGDGAFYRRHLDVHVGEQGPAHHRVLSAVYYFHRQPRAFSGGALRIFSFDLGASVDVEPIHDTLIAFATSAPHEVLPVAVPSRAFLDSRFAINCWVLKARTK